MMAFQSAFSVLRASAVLMIATGAVGCSSDDEKPPTPPTLEVRGLRLSGGSKWLLKDGGAPKLELGCESEILTVEVGPSDSPYQLGEWELRAPETCGFDKSCGHLVLTIEGQDGRIEKRSARRFIEVSSEELPGLGELSVKVELVNDFGTPVEDDDGSVTDSVEFEITQASGCDSSTGG